MNSLKHLFVCWFIVVLAVSGCQPIQPMTGMSEVAPREILVWVGGGQDTAVIEAFLPETVHIRAGDTVMWQLGHNEFHTVDFFVDGETAPFAIPVPGGQEGEEMVNPPSRLPGAPVEVYDSTKFASSSLMSFDLAGPGAPPNDKFSLTFEQPGTYDFICQIHPWMTGQVVVEAATATDVPNQEAINAQAETERAALLAEIELAREQGAEVRSQPGPHDNTIWHVRAGGINFITGDQHAYSFDLMPQELTIESGDTVVWTSAEYHIIVFDDAPPAPEPFVLQPAPEGSASGTPIVLINNETFTPAQPSAVYDPTQYYSSGGIGPVGDYNGWALTFEQPGTYDYFCPLHVKLGMKGTIIVK